MQDSTQPTPLPSSKDGKTPRPAGFIQRYGLKLSGMLNFVGDVLLLWAGISKIGKGEAGGYALTATGALYTAGALNLAVFGNPTPEIQADIAKSKLNEFFRDKNTVLYANLPKLPSQALSRSAAQNTLYLYTLGASTALVSGVQEYRHNKKQFALTKTGEKPNLGMIGYGLLSLLTKAVTLSTPEATPQDNAKPAKGIIAWFKSKPLRIFGYGSLLTEGALAYSAYGKLQSGKVGEGEFRKKMGTAAAYAVSDVIIAQSSKNVETEEAGFSGKLTHELEQMAAERIIQSNDVTEQAKLVDEASEYLSNQAGASLDKSQFKTQIIEKIAKLSKPKAAWADRASDVEALPLQR